MLGPLVRGAVREDLATARRVLVVEASSRIMSPRAHFWLRLAGLALILAAEFVPRLWTPGPPSAPSTSMVAADLR